MSRTTQTLHFKNGGITIEEGTRGCTLFVNSPSGLTLETRGELKDLITSLQVVHERLEVVDD